MAAASCRDDGARHWHRGGIRSIRSEQRSEAVKRYSPEHQTEDVKGRRLDDTPLRSGDLDRLLEPSQEAESFPSQLPPQNTEAEMARQDPGHGSPGADRNPQHPRHAEASETAMERPPGENGRRATTQTTFLRRCRYGFSPAGRSKTTLQEHFEEIAEATANQLVQDRPAWRRSVKTGSAIYEANRIAATKAKRAARMSPAPRTNIFDAQALPKCPRCQRIFCA
ncbi:unnamed protein product [Schistocephalus solidus]|uniref:Uncharacterized protein n=1 Tax=Schistocephalus solidus TaxID=70667 RepID=A0A183SP83_SCHSO|nr:unnamed protein product [Schistocephalus solidus]